MGREVRYAKPYDYSIGTGYYIALSLMAFQFLIIGFFIIWLIIDMEKRVDEYTISWFATFLYILYLMFFVWNHTRISIRKAILCQGWSDIAGATKSLGFRFTILPIIPIIIVIVNDIITNSIDFKPILFLFLFLTIIKIISSYFGSKLIMSKKFKMSLGDAKYFLVKHKEKLLLTSSALEKKQFQKFFISVENEKISVCIGNALNPWNRSCNVFITTPRDQSDRHRELREAVSAILEGRPWPQEPGDGDAQR